LRLLLLNRSEWLGSAHEAPPDFTEQHRHEVSWFLVVITVGSFSLPVEAIGYFCGVAIAFSGFSSLIASIDRSSRFVAFVTSTVSVCLALSSGGAALLLVL
jgi:hypothetical protein